jgi:hypothetical protein
MDNTKVRRALENAELMLAFCAEKGIDIPEESINIIVITRIRLDKEEALSELEAKFWNVYTFMAKRIYPVTIESLKTVNLKPDWESKTVLNRMFSAKSVAHESVNVYRFLGLIVMLVMLLVQIYWVIGAKLVSDITSEIPKEVADIKQRKAERETALGTKAINDGQVLNMELKLMELNDKLLASSVAVKNWNRLWKKLIPISEDSVKRDAEIYIEEYLEVKYASFILDATKEYLLPLLYGLLGAFAFIFRDIFLEIRNKTFTPESTIKYILRLHLGALTGLAIGWFFGGDSSQSYFAISNLSPLALSFLGGYGVEILFAGMDRLISAFSDNQPPKKESPPAENGKATEEMIKKMKEVSIKAPA